MLIEYVTFGLLVIALWDHAAVRETFALVMHRWLLSERASAELLEQSQEVRYFCLSLATEHNWWLAGVGIS